MGRFSKSEVALYSALQITGSTLLETLIAALQFASK
jgi:hypothetical protein